MQLPASESCTEVSSTTVVEGAAPAEDEGARPSCARDARCVCVRLRPCAFGGPYCAAWTPSHRPRLCDVPFSLACARTRIDANGSLSAGLLNS